MFEKEIPVPDTFRGVFDGFPKEGETPRGEPPVAGKVPESSESSTENGAVADEIPPEKKGEAKPGADVAAEKPPEKEGEPVPFHRHPRWQKLNRENRNLAKRLEEYDSRLEKFDSYVRGIESDRVPEEFLELYGDNPEAWAKFRALHRKLNPPAQKSESEKEDLGKYEQWVEDRIQELEDDGESFDRNELLSVLREYIPTDAEGNINFRKGLKILAKFKETEQLKSSQNSEARKALAANVTGTGKADGNPPQALTSDQIRKMDWHTAARMFL